MTKLGQGVEVTAHYSKTLIGVDKSIQLVQLAAINMTRISSTLLPSTIQPSPNQETRKQKLKILSLGPSSRRQLFRLQKCSIRIYAILIYNLNNVDHEVKARIKMRRLTRTILPAHFLGAELLYESLCLYVSTLKKMLIFGTKSVI